MMEEILKNNSRQGTCIPSTYEDLHGKFYDMALAEQAFVVHGWIYSSKLNQLIKHAWIEFTDPALKDLVYDVVYEIFIRKKYLQEKYQLKEVKRYDIFELMKLSIKYKSLGGEFEF